MRPCVPARLRAWPSLLRPLLGLLACTSLAVAKPAALDVPLVVTELPAAASPAAAPAGWNASGLVRADRFDGARLVLVAPDGGVRVLSEGFASACDPDLSFDGKTLLFAGQKTAGAPWRIWQMALDGSGLRAITPDSIDARDPIHVSTLFTLNSPQPWETLLFVGREAAATETGATPLTSLYSIKLDGGELRRLTYNPNSSLDPFQMWDGRVIYASGRQAHEPPSTGGRLGLFAIHIEGADMELYGGELGRRIQQMPCATEGGLVLFVESDAAAPDGAGQLAWVEQRRPHLTYHPAKTDAAHLYAYPTPLQKNEVLVAQRPVRGAARWAIVRFDADTGATTPVYASKDQHAVQAVPVRPRPSPDGHSTVVTTNDNYGTLYGLDCYTTDAVRAGKLPPGTVKRVRLIEGMPATPGVPTSPVSPTAPRRLVGEAAVEADGSFNLFVPADTPLLLQTVDENGLALSTCNWIWVKSKEKRGCIGCHEDPERVPENRFVLALHHDSVPLLPPVAERRTVTFTRDVAPILSRLTAPLLDPHQRPLQLTLDAPAGRQAAYQALLAGPDALVEPGRARTSRLIWQLTGRNTARPWDAAATVKLAPTAAPALSAEDLRTLILWIDLGAAYEAPAQPAPTAKETAAQ